ncbi:MAG: chemotaxis protein MotA [Bradymonadia bacterium]|jgi:chemotaxis protein MotA
MDIATILGFVLTFGLIVTAILIGGTGLGAFLDPPSILIVVAGTFTTVLINYPFGKVIGAIKVAMNTIMFVEPDVKLQNIKLLELANTARKEGILALEKELANVDDPMMKKGLQLLVDGLEPEMIENMMYDEIAAMSTRHSQGAEVFSALGAISPALGLIGTLIGLVAMLQNMDDPSAIGPAMAVAMLTTFYGALLANIVFNPMAGKLRIRHQEEELAKNMVVKGLMGIANGVNPRILEQALNAELPPSQREDAAA